MFYLARWGKTNALLTAIPVAIQKIGSGVFSPPNYYNKVRNAFGLLYDPASIAELKINVESKIMLQSMSCIK